MLRPRATRHRTTIRLGRIVPALLLTAALAPAACGSDDGPNARPDSAARRADGEPPERPVPGEGWIRASEGQIVFAREVDSVKVRRPSVLPGDSTWNGFHQRSESFLYMPDSADRVVVAGKDGLIAEFACRLPAVCGGARSDTALVTAELVAFGPDRDEVTVPVWDADGRLRSLQVVGFDGRTREELDVSWLVRRKSSDDPGRELTDMAWSPDGARLAVSTRVNASACDPGVLRFCAPRVSFVDREGDPSQPDYTGRHRSREGHLAPVELINLAWAPDGDRLGLIETPSYWDGSSEEPPRARLLVLRSTPGHAAAERAVHVFAPCVCPRDGLIFGWQLTGSLGFAWSPDGTRIAVVGRRRVAEISADDGGVLATHRRRVLAPLAWLRDRP